MSRTVLITGTSTGIGRATAERFQREGWNVGATMRSPNDGQELSQHSNVHVTRLDVTDPESITTAVAETMDRFGSIDALINNAGFGAYGPLEITSSDTIERQFDTNVIGLLEVTKAVIPIMRNQGAGVIVNISSVGGRIAFPFGSLYHGSKFAVEGISEALVYELMPFGIRVKVVEPGAVATDFAGRSFVFTMDPDGGPYGETMQSVMTTWGARMQENMGDAESVADVIFTAATDGTTQLRYISGDDAATILGARQSMDDEAFTGMIASNFGLNSTHASSGGRGH